MDVVERVARALIDGVSEGDVSTDFATLHPDDAEELAKKAIAAMLPDEESAVERMWRAAQSDVRKSTATKLDMQAAYRALMDMMGREV